MGPRGRTIPSPMSRPELTPSEIVDILRTSTDRLRLMTGGLSDAQTDETTAESAWSIRYILAHLRAADDVLGDQMMRIVAEDRPSWRRLSPRTYMRRTDYPSWPVPRALAALGEHRQRLLDVLEPLPHEAWQRTALVTDHPGKVIDHTLRYYGDWLAGHEREHLAQIESMAVTVRGA
jgi:hypothetical protein